MTAKQAEVAAKQRHLAFEDILSATDTEDVEVAIPEWGGSVVIRPLTKNQQRDMRKQCRIPGTDEVDEDKLESMMLVHGMREPAITLEQAEAMMERAAAPVDRVLGAIMTASGMDKEAVKKAEKSFPEGT